MKVVVVESPAKAKTINKYLGSDFHVVASYGHVRDLPAKDGSVRPDEGFAMDWVVDPRSEKHIKDIAGALKGADKLFLATDPDREGEAISWHVRRVLEERKALKGVDVKRVVFNEITKSAVLDAMRNPRDIDQELVDAYMARRALDYLVGFTLSPVLWRKLPGSRSAGRVQSVALRLICEREGEIEDFRPREYWTVAADFLTPRSESFSAHLTHLDGIKLDKFALPDAAAAMRARQAVEAGSFSVAKVERKKARRNPFPPFTTSTLQQEASRKLHLPTARTMQIAQRLYEGIDIGGETVGLITYMRTDGVQMAAEAIAACRTLIGSDFGNRYCPDTPRVYKTKAKNAQEAHECIRPTDLFRRPEAVARYLDRDQLRLYEMIWKRTVASQMAAAELDQVAVDVADGGRRTMLRATGQMVTFDGFMKVYREDRDDTENGDGDAEDGNRLLPDMTEGEALDQEGEVRARQHFTQPPPRFTEASLVKQMEELGIGRPSTYASILSVLQDRNYVRLDQRRFMPEDRGRLVTAFLEQYFKRYVEYNFTADLENRLDDISGGRIDWRTVLEDFWRDFSASVGETKDLRVSEVIETLDRELGAHFFPPTEDGHDPRLCPGCNSGRLSLKLGKFGAFLGCSNYPECRYTRALAVAGEGDGATDAAEGPRELGEDPANGLMVTLRKGPYGWYVQREAEPEPPAAAEAASKKKGRAKGPPKPKRVSLPRDLEPTAVTLTIALALLGLPREVGLHPETGKAIIANIGRFGPYLQHDGTFKSLPKGDDVLSVGLNRAVDLLAQKNDRKGAAPLRVVGEHDGKPVTLHDGRFGPYVACDGMRATLPKGTDGNAITLDEAMALIAQRAAKGGAGKAAAKKPSTAKAATKTLKAATKTVKAAAKSPAKKVVRPAAKSGTQAAAKTTRSRKVQATEG